VINNEGNGDEGGRGAKAMRAMATAMATAMGLATVTATATGTATVTATVTATTWDMATVMRLAGDKEGRGKGGKAMTTAMRVVGKEEGKGSKAMGLATRVVGKWTASLPRLPSS
jgi:hypothetical protein